MQSTKKSAGVLFSLLHILFAPRFHTPRLDCHTAKKAPILGSRLFLVAANRRELQKLWLIAGAGRLSYPLPSTFHTHHPFAPHTLEE